ncbi:glycosyltransferase [Zygosaccharomyces rouxii]|nr:glycosyltransferase [Zygosaccharomyces rouxii]
MIYNPRSTLIWGPMLLAFESALLKLIIWKVPYTEIDYKAYMEQIDIIKSGETDYTKIYGGTGPLVYPAGHVLIYRFMHWLTEGTNFVHRGQHFFRCLYLLTLALQFFLYYRLQLPGWCVVLASLSKRLHSIYVLRLFNDCFTTFFMVVTVLLLQLASDRPRRWLTYVAALTFSFALSIKMNALLYLPGIAVTIFYLQNGNLLHCLICAALAVSLQYSIAIPFLSHWRSYLICAFDFQRKFLYRWTINWHFLDEETFNSNQFHLALLATHMIVILTLFSLLFPNWRTHLYRACCLHEANIFLSSDLHSSAASPKGNHPAISGTLPLIVTTNFAGVICARSLHYQFLSWYHWTLPILLCYSGFPAPLGMVWYAIHEWCWNSYPPNSLASAILVSLNGTLLICCGVAFYITRQKNQLQQQHGAVPAKSRSVLSDGKED